MADGASCWLTMHVPGASKGDGRFAGFAAVRERERTSLLACVQDDNDS